MSYLYETHLHSCQASACGVSFGHEYIRRYQDLGFSGVIITDHFYRGNSCVSRRLPWHKWVREFCRGYEDARNEGEKRGLDVFFGWEETYDDDDYLIYGLSPEWLLDHREAVSWTRKQQFDAVDAAGGCVVQAHPFRQHYYISGIHLSTGCVHAVEAANAGNNDPSYDALAMAYAKRLGLPFTAGSDIHDVVLVRRGKVFGVYLDTKITSVTGYVDAVRNKRIAGLLTSPGRCDLRGNEKVTLPVDIRDKNDHSTGQNLWQFLNEEK